MKDSKKTKTMKYKDDDYHFMIKQKIVILFLYHFYSIYATLFLTLHNKQSL